MDQTSQIMVRRAISDALKETAVSAAFVYGSVAAGTAHSGSDLDTFVLLTEELDIRARQRLRASFRSLQARLGFQSDTVYPVELFSIAAANAALDLADMAALDGSLAALPAESDEREVLGALTGPRLLVCGGPHLDQLTARAARLATLFSMEAAA